MNHNRGGGVEREVFGQRAQAVGGLFTTAASGVSTSSACRLLHYPTAKTPPEQNAFTFKDGCLSIILFFSQCHIMLDFFFCTLVLILSGRADLTRTVLQLLQAGSDKDRLCF